MNEAEQEEGGWKREADPGRKTERDPLDHRLKVQTYRDYFRQ